jgi:hypothetical protein
MKMIPCYLLAPSRPYKEIDMITADSPGLPILRGAIKTLRDKATQVGADAVIIKETSDYKVVGSAIVFIDKHKEH